MKNLENFRQRLYQAGFVVDDFQPELMKRGLVIVQPMRPTGKSSGGVLMPGEATGLKGVSCAAFGVVAVAAQTEGALKVKPGDVVTLRQAHLDPLDDSQNVLAIKDEHLLSRWPDDHDEPPMPKPSELLVPDTDKLIT